MTSRNETDNDDFYIGDNMMLSTSIRFWLYLVPDVLSIICSCFVLQFLLFHRSYRQALNNHVFIVLLIIGLLFELIDVPLTLHYYILGESWKLSPTFSLFWTYIDFSTYTAQIVIFAWATIERHILTFKPQWVLTSTRRFFFHYLPLFGLVIYIAIYCVFIIYFPPCKNLYNNSVINGVPVPCVLVTAIGKFDLICHQIIPTFIIVVFSIALFVRVLYYNKHLNGLISWRKQRTVAMQLLNTSILYLFFNFPWTVIDLIHEIGISTDSIDQIRSHAYFFSNYVIFLFPFVCYGSFPKFRKQLNILTYCKRRRPTVVPDVVIARHVQEN